jgi:hypothetical protein
MTLYDELVKHIELKKIEIEDTKKEISQFNKKVEEAKKKIEDAKKKAEEANNEYSGAYKKEVEANNNLDKHLKELSTLNDTIIIIDKQLHEAEVYSVVVSSEAVSSEVVSSEAVSSEVVQSDVVSTNVVQSKVVQSKVVQSDVVQSKVVQSKVVQSKVVSTNKRSYDEALNPYFGFFGFFTWRRFSNNGNTDLSSIIQDIKSSNLNNNDNELGIYNTNNSELYVIIHNDNTFNSDLDWNTYYLSNNNYVPDVMLESVRNAIISVYNDLTGKRKKFIILQISNYRYTFMKYRHVLYY